MILDAGTASVSEQSNPVDHLQRAILRREHTAKVVRDKTQRLERIRAEAERSAVRLEEAAKQIRGAPAPSTPGKQVVPPPTDVVKI